MMAMRMRNQSTVSNKCDDYEDYHEEDEESDAGTSNSHTDQCPLRRGGGYIVPEPEYHDPTPMIKSRLPPHSTLS